MTRDELLKLLHPSADWVAPKAHRRKGEPPEPTVVWVDGQKCRLIELTRGFKALIDEADMELVCHNFWMTTASGYAARMVGPRRSHFMKYMHIAIFGDGEVDHRNQIQLDNRRLNLRSCTHAQNCGNTPSHSDKLWSMFKGVTWRKFRRKWTTVICCNGNRKRVYYGDSEIEAAKAYDRAALDAYGEFACINFPTDGRVPATL